jgi:hypothetical protein
VCRRWRNLVFGSARRLNLQIKCTNEARVKEKLDAWPALPIVISGYRVSSTGIDNIIAALEHHDRVCKIKLRFAVREPEEIVLSMEETFPILTDLDLSTMTATAPFRSFDPDPSKFLRGAPLALRSLALSDIWASPDALKLLLYTPNLVILRLENSPSFRPDELVAVLSALPRLSELHIQGGFPGLDHGRLPPLTRTVLPSLTELTVDYSIEIIEDFMARIDAPLLNCLYICLSFPLFDRAIGLDIPQLLRFIVSHSKATST